LGPKVSSPLVSKMGVRAGELWWTPMRKEGRERADAYGT
jgi:hypothetical protein